MLDAVPNSSASIFEILGIWGADGSEGGPGVRRRPAVSPHLVARVHNQADHGRPVPSCCLQPSNELRSARSERKRAASWRRREGTAETSAALRVAAARRGEGGSTRLLYLPHLDGALRGGTLLSHGVSVKNMSATLFRALPSLCCARSPCAAHTFAGGRSAETVTSGSRSGASTRLQQASSQQAGPRSATLS